LTALDVAARLSLENDGVDPAVLEETAEYEPRWAGADDRDLCAVSARGHGWITVGQNAPLQVSIRPMPGIAHCHSWMPGLVVTVAQ